MKLNARLLVRLYPRAWRERYGAELLALIDECGVSGARASIDLAAGALREHLRAMFVNVSPQARQHALRMFIYVSSWAVGASAAAAIALSLPDVERGSAMRSFFLLGGVLGSLGVYFYVSVLKLDARQGLAPGVPPLTPTVACLLAFLAILTAVMGDLGSHAFRSGDLALSDALVLGLANSMLFGNVGVGIAAMLRPDRFRDLNLDPPTMGLGA